MAKNVIKDTITHNVLQYPNKVSVKTSEKQSSYKELDELSNQIASHLLHKIKIEFGFGEPNNQEVRIGICIPRDSYLVPAIWAICKLGYTYVPLEPEMPDERLKFIISDCRIAAILTETKFIHRFADVSILNLSEMDSAVYEDGNYIDNHANPFPQTAYIIYTSGTTGTPKGVPVSYGNLLNLLRNVSEPTIFNISVNSRIISFASINFDASIIEIYASLFNGSTLVIADERERRDIRLLSGLIREEKITFVTLPPSLAVLMQDMTFPALDTLVIAGEKMLASIAEKVSAQHYRLINAYGPTENTVMSTMREVSRKINIQNIGKPIPGVVGHVVHPDFRPVVTGETGELCIGGAQLASGYLNRPELNRKSFVPNPFSDKEKAPVLYKTGDIVRLMPDGSYDFIGRKDSQVKFNGYRIEPDEIACRIEQCEEVMQAYVRIETKEKGDLMVAYIKLAGSLNDKTIEKIKKDVRNFLPHYMMPSFWIPITEFPLNINGKIDITSLPGIFLKQDQIQKKARKEEEDTAAHVIAHLSGLDDIDIDSDLFDDLGMTSIQIMQIPMELEIFGLYVSVKDIYQQRTLRKIIHNCSKKLDYWYNEPLPGKPVLVVVSGYTSFSFLYGKVAEAIADLYSIYVLESYHEYSEEVTRSCETLILDYIQTLLPIVKEYRIAAITGFCLGGELGLYLAHELHKRFSLLPSVIVLDGEVCRSKAREEYIPLYMDILPDRINVRRCNRDIDLATSFPDFRYEGRVTSILANHFTSDLSPLSKKILPTKKQKECARLFYDRNPEMWKKYYPDCELLYVEADHWTFLHTKENTDPIIAYCRSLYKQFYK